ncbi:methyltransferase [Pseudomonas aeruginosa]
MFPHLFKRAVPTVPPLFSTPSLQLSDKVQWLASKGLMEPITYAQRHFRGDWGDVSDAECKVNTAALQQKGPLYSCYRITPLLYLSVTTDDRRSLTIVQLLEERSVL